MVHCIEVALLASKSPPHYPPLFQLLGRSIQLISTQNIFAHLFFSRVHPAGDSLSLINSLVLLMQIQIIIILDHSCLAQAWHFVPGAHICIGTRTGFLLLPLLWFTFPCSGCMQATRPRFKKRESSDVEAMTAKPLVFMSGEGHRRDFHPGEGHQRDSTLRRDTEEIPPWGGTEEIPPWVFARSSTEAESQRMMSETLKRCIERRETSEGLLCKEIRRVEILFLALNGITVAGLIMNPHRDKAQAQV